MLGRTGAFKASRGCAQCARDIEQMSGGPPASREDAASARAAEPLGAWRPDVVISDIGLRGGYMLVKALRAAGRDAQLRKPVEALALLATVARVAQPAGV